MKKSIAAEKKDARGTDKVKFYRLLSVGLVIIIILLIITIFNVDNGLKKYSEKTIDVPGSSDRGGRPSGGAGGNGESGVVLQVRSIMNIEGEPFLGDEDAPVIVVECVDFQCPHCKKSFEETLPGLIGEYVDSGKVTYVVKDMPLSAHSEADEAAIAANCAGQQGKYWEMHELILRNQQVWVGKANEFFKQYASELGLDVDKYGKCLEDPKQREEIEQDFKECISSGATGTPTFYINGIELGGAYPIESFRQIIEPELSR